MVISMENIIKDKRKEIGLSHAIENNKYDPTLTLAFKLAKELNITVDELFIYDFS